MFCNGCDNAIISRTVNKVKELMKQISVSSSCVMMHVTNEVTNASFMSPRFRSPCLRNWLAAAHGSRPRWARWSPRSRASWRPRRRSATPPWRARATRTWGSVWRGLSLDTGTWSSYSRLWQGENQIRESSFQFHIHDWCCSNIWPDWVSQTWIGNFPQHNPFIDWTWKLSSRS